MKTRICLIFILLFFIFGCASAPQIIQEKTKPIFYPPEANEPPRLQFLTSFSSSNDLEASTSVFRKFIVGDEKNIKSIIKPYGIEVYGYKIYICDTVANAIDILDLSKNKFEYFRPKEEFQLVTPINLSFDANGNMYIADSTRGQVVIFAQNGDYLGALGRKAELKPTDVLVKDDKIYICDLKSHSIKIFGLTDKRYLFSIPKEGSSEEARLFSPTNIAIDDEGSLYVTDTGAFRVQKYDSSGEFLMSIGSHGDAAGQFARPKGIAVDRKSRVYVVDAAFENVQFFNKKGKLLMAFAGPGQGKVCLVLPAGIVVDYSLVDYFSPLVDPSFAAEYIVLVTSQYGEHKVSVFAFGSKK